MIYQHMHGLRPMNLKHAQAYAMGLKCQLADISPRLAAEAANNAQQIRNGQLSTAKRQTEAMREIYRRP